MTTDVLMPALSPTMTEGKLAKWLKKVGDRVKAGDVLAEIETDKATMEVEAVDEGELLRILVDEGTENVAVNTPIAVLGAHGEKAESPSAAASQAPRRRRRLRPRPRPRPRPRTSPLPRRRRRLPRWRRPPRTIGARRRKSPSARHCAMRWPPRCGAMPTCS